MAAELFSEAAGDVFWDHALVDTHLLHFDDVAYQELTPGWEFNQSLNRWEMNWTQNPPAMIPISAHARFHDMCTPMETADVKAWAELTVTQVGAWPPVIMTDNCSTPGYPNQWYHCDGSPQIFLDASLGPINVAGNQGNTYQVMMEIEIDHQAAGVANDIVWGYIFT